jgi:hypothetical protein
MDGADKCANDIMTWFASPPLLEQAAKNKNKDKKQDKNKTKNRAEGSRTVSICNTPLRKWTVEEEEILLRLHNVSDNEILYLFWTSV